MPYFGAIGLISAAMILLELALLRLFAVQQFYHFAFMAISLALLGAGASGSLLTLRGRRFSPVVLCLAFSVTSLGAYLVINYLPFDSYSIAWDSRQLIFLALYFLVIAIPFLFSGLLAGGELLELSRARSTSPGSHQVYGANLIGSAVGSLASLLILAAAGSVGTVLVVIISGAIAALLFILDSHATVTSNAYRRPTAGALLIIVTGLVLLVVRPNFLKQRLSPYKTLPILSQALDAQPILTVEDATARVDVLKSGTIHIMPGLSLLTPVGLPPQAGLMLDGDNLMPVTDLDPDSEQALLLAAYRPEGVAAVLRPAANTLVIDGGTGSEVLFALASGAETVTLVEENRLVTWAMAGELALLNQGLFTDPRVTVATQSGRVFARRYNGNGFDLAIVALTDPHRPVSSGAYSLTEDYTHTVQAFEDYLETLTASGLLVVTRWVQTPPSESARTFATLAEALSRKGVDPAQHLLAFRTVRTMTLLASKEPFSPGEIEQVRDFLERRSFDEVYSPGINPEALNRFNLLPEPIYHDLFVKILTDPEQVYQDYRFDIRPPVDDRPFFFHYFKWRQTPEILASLGLTWQPFGGSGYFVLVALLILVSLAAALFIIGPLVFRRRMLSHGEPAAPVAHSWRWRVLLYFAFLGLAYLFVEVPLAQRFILVLDQPVTALAVVLFAMLLFSGLGSLTAPRWRMRTGLGVLVGLIVVYPLVLGPLSDLLLPLPALARISLTIVLIAPAGYLMGLPFAGGLRVVEYREPGLVPWAWAVNGSFSVISSVLAVMVAVSLGFPAVLWLGALTYGGALLVFWNFWHKAAPA